MIRPALLQRAPADSIGSLPAGSRCADPAASALHRIHGRPDDGTARRSELGPGVAPPIHPFGRSALSGSSFRPLRAGCQPPCEWRADNSESTATYAPAHGIV